MRRIAPNKYECSDQEDIQLNFDAHPSRANVDIHRSFDNGPLERVLQNFIKFKFLGSKRKLTLTFAFLVDGDCDIEITTVTPVNDTDNASSLGGIPVQKDYLFVPQS